MERSISIRSTYQAKTLEEAIYYLDEIECKSCGKWFMADYGKMDYVPVRDQARLFAKCFCPYCGAISKTCM